MIKKFVSLLICFITILSISTTFATPTTPEVWNSNKGNPANTGYVDKETSEKVGLKWKYFFTGDMISNIVAFERTIYFIDRNGFLYSVSEKDGSENYKKRIETDREITGIDIDSDNIYVTTTTRMTRRNTTQSVRISAYSRLTGELSWKVDYGDTAFITPPLKVGESVFIGLGKLDLTTMKTKQGSLVSLNPKTGSENFSTNIEEEALAFMNSSLTGTNEVILAQTIKITSEGGGGGRMRMNMSPPKLVAFSALTGKILWQETPTEENMRFGTPSIKGEYLYLTENAGFAMGGGGGPPGGGPPGGGREPTSWILKIELKTGKVVKSMSFKNEMFGSFSPTLANDAIYINSFIGNIYSISYELDKIYWTKRLNRFSQLSELISSKNFLYTAIYDGYLNCVSKSTGSVRFQYRVGKNAGTPVIIGDSVIISGEAIYCFSADAEPVLILEPSSLSFGEVLKGNTKQLSFKVIYTGLETINGKVTSLQNWLLAKPKDVTTNMQTFFAEVNTTNLTAGEFEGEILVETNIGEKRVKVYLTVYEPPPLKLNVNLPEGEVFTNKKALSIVGETEPFTDVDICGLKIKSDQRGSFSHNLKLKEGLNEILIDAFSIDGRSKGLKKIVILDTIPPLLQLNLSKINILSEKKIKIIGKTEPDSSVKVNDELVEVKEDGTFEKDYFVNDEYEIITIIATDKAMNNTEYKAEIYVKTP